MPCYDKCKTFYYYDVLEALSRHLFQTIINQKKKKLEDELLSSDSESDDMSDSDSDKLQNGVDGRIDTASSFPEHEYNLTEREIEDREDILMGSLEEILRKLEDKGVE